MDLKAEQTVCRDSRLDKALPSSMIKQSRPQIYSIVANFCNNWRSARIMPSSDAASRLDPTSDVTEPNIDL